MPSINLIASQREEKRRLKQNTHYLFYAILAEVGAMLVVTSFMVVKLMTTESHIAQLSDQMRSLQPKVDQIQSLQASIDKLKPKVTTLTEAKNTTLYWYTALQTVNASLPDHAWLTNIGTSGDPTPPKPAATTSSTDTASSSGSTPPPATPASPPEIVFTGMAATSDQVGVAMMKMNQFTNISSVTLDSVNQDGTGPVKPMKFSMVVTLKPNTALDANLLEPAATPAQTASAVSINPYSNASITGSRGASQNHV